MISLIMDLARDVNHKLSRLAALSNVELEGDHPKRSSVMMEM
jgi:hypothetical protein